MGLRPGVRVNVSTLCQLHPERGFGTLEPAREETLPSQDAHPTRSALLDLIDRQWLSHPANSSTQ